MRATAVTFLVLALGLAGCGRESSASATPIPDAPLATDEAPGPAAPAPAAPGPAPSPPAEAWTHYLGRELAPTMSHEGADWLTRPERDAEENTTLLHRQLGLRPGDVACDLGAGNGYHTLRMAQAVGKKGRVYAIDLQPQMLYALRQRAEAAGLSNIAYVRANTDDPKIEPGRCDLILIVDVYHELSDPAAVLGHLSRALTPRGRIALVEFRAEDPDVPIKALHKMSRAQILREYEANGLQLADEFDGLPWQHLMFFRPAP
jgi:SAM-dependent methyltransferase